MRGARIACKIVIGKPKRERPFGRPTRRWKDNIRMDVIGWEVADWINLVKDKEQSWALVSTVMNLRVP
jgi:hypothetical protein